MSNEPNSDSNAGGERDGNAGKTEAQIRAEVEAEFQNKVKDLIENNGAYKSLQTALNRSHQDFQSKMASKEQELATIRAQNAEMASGLDFLSETVVGALGPDDQAKVMEKLRARQIKGLENQINDMRKQASQPAATQGPALEDEYREQIKQLLIEAQDSLEDAVKAHGLDPKEKGLDYGKEDETFAKRLKTLNASIKTVQKAKEDAGVEDVRQNTTVPPTRQSGGAAIDPKNDGKSLGERAFEDMWAKMQREAQGKKR